LLLASSSSNTNIIVPNGTFFFELVIFLVVLGIVAKFILPPFQRVLDQRDQKVREGLGGAESARQEAAQLDADRLATLHGARSRARQLLEEAGDTVDQLIADARQRGQQEHDRRIEAAAGEIEQERLRIHGELVARAELLVVSAAERVVGGTFDLDRHRGLIAAELADLDRPAGS
jgi:F-type H+-transporting ATPase subunit b